MTAARRPAELTELRGVVRRSLFVGADGRRDTTTDVAWLQGLSLYVDLRRPADLPDVAAGCRDELTDDVVAALARQEAFAGRCTQLDGVTRWAREIDLHPPAGPDAGRLTWARAPDGSVAVVEDGVHAAYRELWHPGPAPAGPVWGLRLRGVAPEGAAGPERTVPGLLLRVGGRFGFARDRAVPLPADLSPSTRLTDLVAAAAPAAAQALVDCEISIGVIDGTRWRVEASTLPYRVGADLAPERAGDGLTTRDVRPGGEPAVRTWQIVESEGEHRWR